MRSVFCFGKDCIYECNLDSVSTLLVLAVVGLEGEIELRVTDRQLEGSYSRLYLTLAAIIRSVGHRSSRVSFLIIS